MICDLGTGFSFFLSFRLYTNPNWLNVYLFELIRANECSIERTDEGTTLVQMAFGAQYVVFISLRLRHVRMSVVYHT